MPQMKSSHWLFGILGMLSLSSVFYTAVMDDTGWDGLRDRSVESQDTIDLLSKDMKRFLSSITDWASFCEDPYAYIRSARSHGNFQLTLLDKPDPGDSPKRSRTTHEALGRCLNAKSKNEPAQFRLCLNIAETLPKPASQWFDDRHMFEVSFEFREKGAKRVVDCQKLKGGPVEVQAYYSAYLDQTKGRLATRVSGGLRLPIESSRF